MLGFCTGQRAANGAGQLAVYSRAAAFRRETSELSDTGALTEGASASSLLQSSWKVNFSTIGSL